MATEKFSPIPSTPTDEIGLVSLICRMVAERCYAASSTVPLRIGPVARRLRSVGITLDVPDGEGSHAVYVKVPRARGTLHSALTTTFTEAERDMARQELDALNFLRSHLSDPTVNVDFVRPVGLVEDVNALVLERVHGAELHRVLRHWDLARRFGRDPDTVPALDLLHRLGQALGRFHRQSLGAGGAHAGSLQRDIHDYGRQLVAGGIGNREIDDAIARSDRWAASFGDERTVTGISGLHLHHFFVDPRGRLLGFDPGMLAPAAPEEDLARLVIGLRCLYWSTPFLALGLHPSGALEKCLIAGWRSHMPVQTAALSLCLVRQTLFRWLVAREGLSYRNWPGRLKRTIQRRLLDPHFRRVLSDVATGGEA